MRFPRHFLMTLVALAVLGKSLPAHASSSEAWASHRAEVVAKCTQASGLKNAQLMGELIEYDDSVGLTVAFIAGLYPQPHVRDQAGRSLCLFDKRTRRAYSAPADAWK